jgi:hypothetical protein
VEWTYVSFGDSVMFTIDDGFMAEIEDRFDVDVRMRDWTLGGSASTALLQQITGSSKASENLRTQLAGADIVTLDIPLNEFEQECGYEEHTADETRDCMTRARVVIGESGDRILDEIARLTNGRPAIVRVVLPQPFLWGSVVEQGIDAVFSDEWTAMNARTAAAASRHGFKVLDLRDVVMGVSRNEDPVVLGYSHDGVHLNAKGTDAAVRALVELGFDDAPIDPD